MSPGPGFGGSCFKKDILNLVYLCNYFGLPEVGSYWENVLTYNTWHQGNLVNTIVQKLFGTLSGKKIIILGFAFKSNTNDTRESPAIFIVSKLLNEGANLIIHDPKVSEDKIKMDLDSFSRKAENKNNYKNNYFNQVKWKYCEKLDNEFKNAHAVIVLTEWNEYCDLDWKAISNQILKSGWIFDTRGILDKKIFRDLNTNFWKIGDA